VRAIGLTHIARQHEFAPRGAHSTLDLRNRDETTGAQVSEQEGERSFTGQLCGFLSILLDSGYIDVRNEIVDCDRYLLQSALDARVFDAAKLFAKRAKQSPAVQLIK
jgi:hypothetical protein